MSSVAVVKSIVGQVFAVSPEGIRRLLVEGDRLVAGEQVDTGPAGAISLELADGRVIDLGRDSQWSANAPDSAIDLSAATAQAAPSVAELQQAIAAGVDPTQNLEPTAAGPTAAGADGAVGGGHSFVVLEATAGVVDPTIGYPTTGLNAADAVGNTLTAGDNNGVDPRNVTITLTATPTITEAGGVVVYTAFITQAPTSDLTVTLSNGLAVVIAAGQTSGALNVTFAGNDTPYLDASSISATITGTVGGGNLIITTDPAPAVTQINDTIDTTTVTLTATASVDEGGKIVYTATVNNAAQTDVVIKLSNDQTITIEAGKTSGTVSVDTPANLADGKDLAVSATITSATGGNYENLAINPAAATSTVVAVDNASVLVADTATIAEDGSATGNVLSNDSDIDNVLTVATFNVDGRTFNAGQTAQIEGIGSITIGADGAYVFTPVKDYSGEVPQIGYTTNTGSSSTLTVTITPVNDLPVIETTANTLVENTAVAGTVAGTFSVSDAETPVAGLVVTFTGDSNKDGYYAIVGNNVVLTQAGADLVNAGNKLPAFDLTVTDAANTTAQASATPDVTLVNDLPTIEVVANPLVEDTVSKDTIAGSFTVGDEETPVANLVVTFTGDSNKDGYYAISGNNVVLTQAGADFVNAGNKLPAFDLTVTDADKGSATAAATPDVTLVNDLPTIEVVANPLVEDTVSKDTIAGSFTVGDEETPVANLVVTFTGDSNKDGYYAISGNNVVLTQAGADFVNAGNKLPAFDLTVTDADKGSATAAATPDVTLVNDLPTIEVVANPLVEDTVSKDTIAGSFTVGDEETPVANLVVTFTGDSNKDGYYAISGNNVVLTQAGADFVNAGNKLPAFDLTVTDADKGSATAAATPDVTLVNDLPTIEVVANPLVEDTVSKDTIAGSFTVGDEETPVANLVVTFTGDSNKDGYYAISGNNVVLTQAGADFVNAGNKLPAFDLTVTDADKGSATAAATPDVTLVNDLPTIEVVANPLVEDTVSKDTIAGSFTVGDEETPVANLVVTFTGDSNKDGYYAISGNNVVLTQAGADFVNAGNKLPAFDLTVTDADKGSATAAATPDVTLVNDLPTIEVVANPLVEDTVSKDTIAGSFTVGDEETPVANLVVTFTGDSNKDGYYAISGNNVVLTQAGADFVNAGNKLPAFDLTVTDADKGSANAAATPDVTLVDDPSVLLPDTGSALEDNNVTGNVLNNDTDEDNLLTVKSFTVDNVTYDAGQQAIIANVGTLTIASTGEYTFTPAKDYNGAVPQIGYTTNTGSSSTLTLTITPVNDAPVLGNASTNAFGDTYIEGKPGGYVAANLTISDVDNDTLQSAKVTLVNHLADDVLIADASNAKITVSYDKDTGVLTLSGEATKAEYQEVLRSVHFASESQNPVATDRTLTITVNDGQLNSAPVTSVVNVVPVNDAPVVSFDSTTFVEQKAAVALVENLSISDVDNTTYSKVVVTVDQLASGDLLSSADVLKALAVAGITITQSGSAADGKIVYTLTSDSPAGNSAADFIKVVEAITFQSPGNNPVGTDRSVTIAVTDIGGGNLDREPAQTGSATGKVAIDLFNDAPTAAATPAGADEDHAATIVLSGADVDGTVANFVITTLPENGKLYSDATLTTELKIGDSVPAGADGKASVYFSPTGDWSGSTSLTFTAVDNGGKTSGETTAAVTIAPVTDTPHLGLLGGGVVSSINFDGAALNGSWSTVAVGAANNAAGTTPTTQWLTGNSDGKVEIGQSSVYGVTTPGNSQVIELEKNTGDDASLYTVIKAESGTAYSISVDYSPRAGAENNSVIDVFWGGVKVGTLDATTVGMKTYTFVVPVTADGDAKLEFKAPTSNSLGGVLDNISVTQVLNTGLEDHAIKLSAIDAYATDKDGSETLKLQISGIPDGATLSDGAGHTFTATAGSQSIDISDWNKATLVFNPAPNANGLVNLTVTAIAQDGDAAPKSESITLPINVIAVNDLPVIDVVANPLVEGSVAEGTVAGTFTISDVETPVADLKVTFTGDSNKDGYYAIVANAVVLTLAGANFVNAGNKLPAIDLTVTDTDKGSAHDAATPTVTLVNDVPVITVEANTLTENDAKEGTVAGRFTATDEETSVADLKVAFTGESNKDGYYAISGTDVVLTQKGADWVNAGNQLPKIDLTVTDADNATSHADAQPAVTLVNDIPVITVAANTIVENTAKVGTVAGTFTASDEETPVANLKVAFTGESNKDGYYAISGTDVVLTQKGADWVNAGNQLPKIDLTVTDADNATSHADAQPAVTLVNDIPVITVEANTLTENDAKEGTVAGRFTATDEETSVADLKVAFTGESNKDGYYAISGTDVVLTQKGADWVNAGNQLPKIDLTVTDADNATSHADAQPAVTLVNDVPVITVEANTLTENDAKEGTVAGRFTATDEETSVADLKVAFTGESNKDGYYAISGTDVVLTQKGADWVNAGNQLPKIDLTVTDADNATSHADAQPAVTLVNDIPVITVAANTIVENTAKVGTVAGTFTASDEETPVASLKVAFTGDSNKDGYYTLSGTDVVLTQKGADWVNAGNQLPKIDLTVTDADNATSHADAQPAVTLVNDIPVITVEANTLTENDAKEGTVAGRFTATDEETSVADLKVAFTGESNKDGYYAISGTDVVLTQKGADWVNAGNQLPKIDLTVTDADNATSHADAQPAVTLVNDIPVITVEANTLTENDAKEGTVAGRFTATDEETSVADLKVAFTGESNKDGYYAISGTDVVLTQKGADWVNAGNQLPKIDLTVTDADNATSHADAQPAVTLVNDVPVITVEANTLTENDAKEGTVAGRFTATDEETSVADLKVAFTGESNKDGYYAISGTDVVLTQKGADWVNAGNQLPKIDLTVTDADNATSHSEATPTVTLVNDVPVITVEANTLTENDAKEGTVAGRFTATDEETSVADLKVAFTGESNKDGYYAISGTDVVLTQKGADWVNAGNQLPKIDLTVTDADNATSHADAQPAVTLVNDVPVITVEANTLTENDAKEGTVAGRFTATDEETSVADLKVAFTGESNKDGYYAISGTDVVLTQKGADWVNAGNQLPKIDLTVTDADNATSHSEATPTVTLVNDIPVITVAANTIVENTAKVGTVAGTFTASDEETPVANLKVAFTGESNKDGYYAISGTDVVLTQKGADWVNAGNQLPKIDLTVTDADNATSHSEATPTVTLVNDIPVITVAANTIVENTAKVGTVAGTFTASDEETPVANLKVAFTTGTNVDAYYTLSGTNVVLTQKGADWVNAGNQLPKIDLTVTDADNATSHSEATPTVTLVNDVPVITVEANTLTENDAKEGTVAGRFTATDEETSVADLKVAFTGESNKDGYYAISGTDVVLTQKGADWVNAGNQLPKIDLTVTDADNATSHSEATPTVTLVNDIPVITVAANTIVENTAKVGTVAGTFTASDEETPVANLKVAFTGDSNKDGYYTLSGTDVVLTQKGADWVNAGNQLPKIDLTVTDTDNATSHADAQPAVTLVNDIPVITVAANTIVENTAKVGTVAGTFTASDEETPVANLKVAFTGESNKDGYYTLSGTDVVLTQKGADWVNAGNQLPKIDLTVTDADNATSHADAQPAVTLVNDIPVITVAANTIVENTAKVGTVAGTFTASDEETPVANLKVAFTTGTNVDAYYTLSGTNVVLTQKGADWVNAGNQLPKIDLTVTDADNATSHSEATPTVTLVNDIPVITVAANTIVENTAKVGTVAGTFTASDEETPVANLKVAFTTGANADGYYVISGTNVVLTQKGADWVNAGNQLPKIDLTVTDADNATSHSEATPTVTLVNDIPVITVAANTIVENTAKVGTVAGTFTASDEETPVANLKVAFTTGANADGYYVISGTNVVLTQKGADWVNAGNQLPKIDLTVTDADNATSHSEATPTVTLVNDIPVITVAANTIVENTAKVGTVAGTFTASDEETPVANLKVAFTTGANADGYYVISGTNVVLTQKGADWVNAGNQLPKIDLTVTDTDNATSHADAQPAVTLVNDIPVITVAANTIVENTAKVGTVAGTFTASDEETPVANLKVAFTTGANADGYYVISGTNVVLTQKGADWVNAGNQLPKIDLTVTDTDNATSHADAQPAVTLVNDIPVITVAANTIVENTAKVGTVAGTFTASDEETPVANLKVAFTTGANADGYYVISGTNVVLTQKGADWVNAGNQLPKIDLTVTDADNATSHSEATPTVTLVNDIPVITVAANTIVENTAKVGTVAGTFTASDEETPVANLKVAFTTGTNVDAYYTLSGTNVVLTQKGADWVNAGNQLPKIDLTVTDADNATSHNSATPTVTLVDDTPTATGSSIQSNEDTSVELAWANFGVKDEDSANPKVVFTSLPAGSIEYKVNGQWFALTSADLKTDTSAGKSFSQADFDNHNVRYTPAANESGDNSFGGTGVGNKQGDYTELKFQATDGNSYSDTKTITVDIHPVTDVPVVTVGQFSAVPTGLVIQTWTGGTLAKDLGTNGNGVAQSSDLIKVIDAKTAASAVSTGVISSVSNGGVAEGTATKVSGLIYLEAGKSYTFTGTADDSLAITVGGKLVASETWSKGSAITGSAYTPTESGYYTLDIYHYNQAGGGNYDVNLSINNGPSMSLGNSGVQTYTSVDALKAAGAVLGDSHVVNGEGYYTGYVYNRGLEDTAIKVAPITTTFVDNDGSESHKVEISGLPKGTVITDGATGHSYTSTGTTALYDVSNWNLKTLTVTPFKDSTASFDITVKATAKELSTGVEEVTTGKITIVVTAVNDAPTLDLSTVDGAIATGYNTSYTERSNTGVAIAGSVAIADVDSTQMQSATITLKNASAGDQLSSSLVTVGGTYKGITLTSVGTDVSGKIVLTLSGAADAATYKALLESFQYSSTSKYPAIGDRSIDVSVTDNEGGNSLSSSVATTTITVKSQVYNTVAEGGAAADTIDLGTSSANNIVVGDKGGITTPGSNYNIAFVVDTSGSIGSSAMNSIKGQLSSIFDTLIANAKLTGSGVVKVLLVDFDTKVESLVSVNLADQAAAKAALQVVLNNMASNPNDMTNYQDAFNAATAWFKSTDATSNIGAKNLTYFITDGEPNVYNYTYASVSLGSASYWWGGNVDFDSKVNGNTYTLGQTTALTATVYDQTRVIVDTDGKVYSYDSSGTRILQGYVVSDGHGGFDVAGAASSSRYDYALDNAKAAYTALTTSVPGGVEVQAIGLGSNVDKDMLQKYFDSDKTVSTIDTAKLADTITGHTADTGADNVSGGSGNDILFGDLISYNGQEGNAALKAFAAEKLSTTVDHIDDRTLHQYITEHVQDIGALASASNIYGTKDGGDTLIGNAGDDILFGQGGNDTLNGGAGNDILVGGRGNDVLTGGAGADTFVWLKGDTNTSGGFDRITDFKHGEGDKLDLSDLLQGNNDTNLSSYLKLTTDASGNSTLSVSSTGSFTAQGGTADVTIKIDGANWGNGSTAINNLIAGGDLTVKHHD